MGKVNVECDQLNLLPGRGSTQVGKQVARVAAQHLGIVGKFPLQFMADQVEPDLEMLKARVKVMRAIGVTKWRDIELGPDPTQRSDDESDTERTAEAEHVRREREYRIRNGASGGPRPRVPSRS